jgi:hypothetical protein
MVVTANGYTYDAFEKNGNVILNKLPQPPADRKVPTLYSLFRKIDGRWNRIRTKAYPFHIAARIWGDESIYNPAEMQIKPVEIDCYAAK